MRIVLFCSTIAAVSTRGAVCAAIMAMAQQGRAFVQDNVPFNNQNEYGRSYTASRPQLTLKMAAVGFLAGKVASVFALNGKFSWVSAWPV